MSDQEIKRLRTQLELVVSHACFVTDELRAWRALGIETSEHTGPCVSETLGGDCGDKGCRVSKKRKNTDKSDSIGQFSPSQSTT